MNKKLGGHRKVIDAEDVPFTNSYEKDIKFNEVYEKHKEEFLKMMPDLSDMSWKKSIL